MENCKTIRNTLNWFNCSDINNKIQQNGNNTSMLVSPILKRQKKMYWKTDLFLLFILSIKAFVFAVLCLHFLLDVHPRHVWKNKNETHKELWRKNKKYKKKNPINGFSSKEYRCGFNISVIIFFFDAYGIQKHNYRFSRISSFHLSFIFNWDISPDMQQQQQINVVHQSVPWKIFWLNNKNIPWLKMICFSFKALRFVCPEGCGNNTHSIKVIHNQTTTILAFHLVFCCSVNQKKKIYKNSINVSQNNLIHKHTKRTKAPPNWQPVSHPFPRNQLTHTR